MGDRTTEFREGIVRLSGGNGDRSSVPAQKAVIAGREERSIRVSDFSGATDSIADHGRIRVITLPAPDRTEGAPRHQVLLDNVLE